MSASRPNPATDTNADVLTFWKNPAIAVESVESKRNEERELGAIESLDGLRRIRNVLVGAKNVLIMTPAFAKSRPSGNLAVRSIRSEQEPSTHCASVAECGLNAGLVFVDAHGADSLMHCRARSRSDFRKTMIELGAKRQIPGRLSFVVAALTRDRLVVKANPVERTIDEVGEFRLEVWESREGESIDPTCAGLVSWKDRFIDDRNRVAKIGKSCRRG